MSVWRARRRCCGQIRGVSIWNSGGVMLHGRCILRKKSGTVSRAKNRWLRQKCKRERGCTGVAQPTGLPAGERFRQASSTQVRESSHAHQRTGATAWAAVSGGEWSDGQCCRASAQVARPSAYSPQARLAPLPPTKTPQPWFCIFAMRCNGRGIAFSHVCKSAGRS